MKLFLLSIIVVLSAISSISAQEKSDSISPEIRRVLNSLSGSFTWKIVRPSSNEIIRTGTKHSSYQLDSLALLGHEEFNDSNIKQMSFMAYNQKDSTFASVGMYNIDIGPHIAKGRLNRLKNGINFFENDSTKLNLVIVDASKYYWTYQNLENGIWKNRDLKIVFDRKE